MSLNDAIEIMHKRLGHISRKRINMMIDQGIITVMKGHKDEFYEKHHCRSCSSSKTPRPSYRKVIAKSKKAGVRWYMDLTGPYTVTSVNGNRYKLALIDSYSNITHEYYMPNKSAETVFKYMSQFISNVIVPTRAADKTLSFIYIYSDCGTEFDNKIISELLLANGIIQDFSCPYTPGSHGKIERLW